MKKTTALILALFMLVAAFAGCGNSKDKQDAKAHGWVNHYLSGAPSSLNQYTGSETNNSTIMGLCTSALYSKLLSEDGTATEMTPIIAAEMPIQLDTEGKEWQIKLRTVPSGQTTALRRWNPDNPTSYEGTIGSLYPSAADPLYGFTYFTSTYNPPRFKWNSPEFDALYARAESREAMNDLDLKLDLCYKMEKMLLDERVIIPMYETPTKVMFNERIQLPVDGFILGFGLAGGAGFGYPMYVSISE